MPRMSSLMTFIRTFRPASSVSDSLSHDSSVSVHVTPKPPEPRLPVSGKDCAERTSEASSCPMALQELGISLSMTGLAGTILICALPMWKVTAFIGTHLVVMQVFWEGLWMTCVSEYTGQMQCKLYDALLDLSPDLQAARGLICISMVLGCLGFLIFLLGARCTNCLSHPRFKAKVVLSSGAIFCLAALTTIVAVSWTANTIIREFHNPRVPEVLKRELGAAIYIGFVTSGLLFCGGAMLCLNCPPQKARISSSGYIPAKTATRHSYAIKNYV